MCDSGEDAIDERHDICDGSENFPIYFDKTCDPAAIRDFTYVRCNIPGPGADRSQFEEQLQGCMCTTSTCDMSRDSACQCVSRFGPAYEAEGCLISADLLSKHSRPITECNRLCSCPQLCRNRVVQKGLQVQLQVFRDDDKGLCLRTLEPIRQHRFVCEYAGEVLSHAEASKRASQQTANDMNYIFALREHCSSGLLKTYVDPCNLGNIGRFLNHSCDPNLCMVPVRVDTPVPHLCLFTTRDVTSGEELTYDYGDQGVGTGAAGVETTKEGKTDHKSCFCKAKSCRGVLPYDSSIL